MEHKESVRLSADFVLVDTPYGVRRSPDVENSEDDRFSVEDMKAMAGLVGAVLNPGRRTFLFFFLLQLSSSTGRCLRSQKRKVLYLETRSRVRKREDLGDSCV